ncbi:MAG: IS21 family transposase [Candidatus Riflebacteria bacterium]|nr:IS21 family transposase [Candidatus Riflebacteria bacterium]
MSRKNIGMRKIKEVFRLKFECNLSNRSIEKSCGVGRTCIKDYLDRAEVLGLSEWEQIRKISDYELEKRLFPEKNSLPFRGVPDWNELFLEKKKPGVTLKLLWEEYRVKNPEGLCYSHFCELYNQNARHNDIRMRFDHKFGDKLFVDYSGKKPEIIDPVTGEVRSVELFVAVLGASNYTFAEATLSQSLPDWIGSHVRALNFFGGCPACIVPDNLRSGVSKALYYDPEINPTYADFAQHYQVTILPARAKKPRDKAKVENGVLIVQRWILAALRNQRFFSLAELNQAIKKLLFLLNERPFKKLPGCRQSMFDEMEKPLLKPLPAYSYEYAEWKKATVSFDYHVEYLNHYYSVHYKYVKQEVMIRATSCKFPHLNLIF